MMKLSDLASIGSLISSAAVLISLVYLALQIRQAERNQRALIHQGRASRMIAKNIERIGDHATNIAETLVYLVSGRSMPPERPHSRPDTDANINIDAAGGDL